MRRREKKSQVDFSSLVGTRPFNQPVWVARTNLSKFRRRLKIRLASSYSIYDARREFLFSSDMSSAPTAK